VDSAPDGRRRPGGKGADAAIATTTEQSTLIHVPVTTGATGKHELRRFYIDRHAPDA